MFQFRRFPTHTYLIQCTLHGYCPCGFPHSEIPGSMDICSSPKLIAACHVLHRLLMPRHSPCALYSLTIVVAKSACLRFRLWRKLQPLPCSSFSIKIKILMERETKAPLPLLQLVREILVLLNYAGFTKILKL